jgi:bacteriochlorophyll 4-vinyl reductase
LSFSELVVNDLVPPSGYYLANRLGRILLESLEETIGRNGLNALLNLTGLGRFIDQPPLNDTELSFDLATVSNLNRALEMIYGPRGARGLALRSGRAMYDRIADGFDIPIGFNDLAFRLLPAPTRLKIGVPALARVLTHHSDQTHRAVDRGAYFVYIIDRCAVCWGQEAKTPLCHLTVGLLQEALSVFGRGQEFRVIQTECRAAGAATCVFRIEKEPIA